MSDPAERSDPASTGVVIDPPDRCPGAPDSGGPRTGYRADPASRRARRSPRLVAALLTMVCVSGCEATTVSGLNIRAAPTTASRVVGKMSNADTMVRVECFTHGEDIHGQTMWYHITQPDVGYIAAYYVRKDSDTDSAPPC